LKAFFISLIPGTLRGRYIFVSLILFTMLAITAIFGWLTVQTAADKHHQKMQNQASIEYTIHSFTVQYQSVKYALLEFLIQPDEQNYQLYNENVLKLNTTFNTLKDAQQKIYPSGLWSNTPDLEADLNNLKQALEKIIKVRLDSQQTFPFTTKMLSLSGINSEILSIIDNISKNETASENENFTKLKTLFLDTRYTWVKLMAEFRLLVTVRFGIFTGAWQQAFEQRAYNVEVYIQSIQKNINNIERLNTNIPLEVESEFLKLSTKTSVAIKKYQQAIILLRSPGWRQDLLLLANQLRPAFSNLDNSIQLLHHKEESNWLVSMSELTTIAQKLSTSLWLLLLVCSALALIGYFMFDKAIIKPIKEVSHALNSQASGAVSDLEKNASTQEISSLMEAFHEMQQQVNSRQQRLVNILDNAAEAIITIDESGTIETFNTASEKLFNYSAAEVLGKNILMLIPEDERNHYQSLFQQYSENDTYAAEFASEDGYEIDVLCKYMNLVPVSIKISKTIIDDKTLYTGLVVDISERRAIENERQQRLAEMAHVGRLSIMGEMAAGIAHELNQPLAAMSLYLQGSLRRCQPELNTCNDVIKAVKSAIEQVDRAGEIIKKMRGFSRRESFHRETIDLNELIIKSVDLVLISQQSITPKPELFLDSRALMVNVDVLQIEQVMVNLIRNAFDAVSALEASKRFLHIKSGLDENGFARVFVIDSGEGVAIENAHKIFDTYFTTKAEGLGMGLSICRSIIEEHNGVLWYRPGNEKGSQFCFVIPVA